ncbi:heme-binding domain-containing protein [Chryseobacterium gotjawalense]|uniref:Heme-binding domain-containing protein n=1 Tax=Chryseobacterium gotjawalense TaxID=3042315 RepID=A0ABY8R9G0_9FLAO|nr:heme-binding domain-containing protein [Chryseobacterium sp. wdc7]WHF50591.1 heme-binding domain-containing protein [Chryseobacterium sp. wdc7]
MKTFLNILYWFLIVIALIQFIPIDRTNKPVDSKVDFVKVYNTPKNVQQLLKTACYDCHSNETVYPKYAYIAPISWSVKHHVNEGRTYLNLSEWGNFNRDLKKDMLKKTVNALKVYSMPMPGYIAQHPGANLNKAERTLLIDYFENILNTENY